MQTQSGTTEQGFVDCQNWQQGGRNYSCWMYRRQWVWPTERPTELPYPASVDCKISTNYTNVCPPEYEDKCNKLLKGDGIRCPVEYSLTYTVAPNRLSWTDFSGLFNSMGRSFNRRKLSVIWRRAFGSNTEMWRGSWIEQRMSIANVGLPRNRDSV